MNTVPASALAALLGPDDEPWVDDALCAQTDPFAFFPDRVGPLTRQAKRICHLCSVRSECLESALAKDERYGVRGGLDEDERRKLRRRELVAA